MHSSKEHGPFSGSIRVNERKDEFWHLPKHLRFFVSPRCLCMYTLWFIECIYFCYNELTVELVSIPWKFCSRQTISWFRHVFLPSLSSLSCTVFYFHCFELLSWRWSSYWMANKSQIPQDFMWAIWSLTQLEVLTG